MLKNDEAERHDKYDAVERSKVLKTVLCRYLKKGFMQPTYRIWEYRRLVSAKPLINPIGFCLVSWINPSNAQ